MGFLGQLAHMFMTTSTLRTTGVGRVNRQRKNPCTEVVSSARRLIRRWKAQV